MIPQAHEAATQRRILDVASIAEGDRLRPVDPEKVAQVARSFDEIGQITDIEVRPQGEGWLLVAGAHRLAAARKLGWTGIAASIFDGSDDLARLREIDENLFRHELNPLDEAVFLAERAEIYRRLHPETAQFKGRMKTPAKLAGVPKARAFSEDVAERTGIGRRTVERALTRFNNLHEAALAVVRGTEIARTGAALDFLCGIEPELQARVARLALDAHASQPLAKRLHAAKAEVTRVAAPTPISPLERAWGAFNRLSIEEREAFIGRLQAGGHLRRRRGEGSAAA